MSKLSLQKLIGKGYNKAWNTKCFYKVIKGSRGSKKSVTTQIEIIAKMMAYPWMNTLVCRRYGNTLRDSVYVGLKSAAHRLGVLTLWEFTVSPMKAVYLPTGQTILFRGFDDPLKLTSIQLEKGHITHLWVEESYELESRDKLDTVVETMRGEIGCEDAYRQVILTFNPWSEFHWLKREFFDIEDEDIFAMTTTYRINEFLDEHTIKRYEKLYKTNPRRARIVCDGEWGAAEGLVFENVEVKDFDKESVYKYTKLAGLDFGFKHDPTALVIAYLDEENETLYIADEHYEQGMTTKDIARTIKRKGYQKTLIIADHADSRLIYELKNEHKLNVKECKKGKKSIDKDITDLQALRIIVHSDCVNMKEEFYSYAYKFDNVAGRYTNKPEDKNNHLCDALRYSLQCISGTKIKMFRNGL